MYALLRNQEHYLCDKIVPDPERMRINADGTVTIRMESIWQKFDDTGSVYVSESSDEVRNRKDRLSRIYSQDHIEIVKLTNDQLQELTYKKLKYAY